MGDEDNGDEDEDGFTDPEVDMLGVFVWKSRVVG